MYPPHIILLLFPLLPVSYVLLFSGTMKRIVLAMLGGFITVFAAAGSLFLCLVFLAKGVWIHACANYTFGLELCQSAGDIFEASFVLLSRRWAKYCYDVFAVTPKTLQEVFTRLWTEALNSLTCSKPGIQTDHGSLLGRTADHRTADHRTDDYCFILTRSQVNTPPKSSRLDCRSVRPYPGLPCRPSLRLIRFGRHFRFVREMNCMLRDVYCSSHFRIFSCRALKRIVVLSSCSDLGSTSTSDPDTSPKCVC